MSAISGNGNSRPTPNNRPDGSKFKQQKLDAWQPILTPSWVIGTFIVMAAIFAPIGGYLISEANSLYDEVVVYDNGTNITFAEDPCVISTMNYGYQQIQATNGQSEDCIIKFTLTKDIPSSDTLFIYYELTEFFQNHRRYVQSRSDSQLQNGVSIVDGQVPSALSTACDPSESLFNNDTKLYFYPCGLIATSYFNDGVQLAYYRSNETDTQVNWTNGIFNGPGNAPFTINTNDIVTDSLPVSQQFKNPTNDTNAWQYDTYAYLWQTYDQMSCYNSANPSERVQCQTWPELANSQTGVNMSVVAGTGCAACPISGSEAVYEGGVKPPSDITNELSDFGIRTENFVIWMRTAALPNFRKIYAKLEPNSTDFVFRKGDEIGFRIIPNFLVQSFGGTKALALATTAPLGGQNLVLGIAYLSVGLLCLLLAILFFLKLKLNPRKLGDPKYLHQKQH